MDVSSTRQYFEETVPELLRTRGDNLKNIGAIYEFQITGDGGGTWTLDLKENELSIAEKSADASDCTIIMQDDAFLSMVKGELKPQMAFLTGQLKVTGNMGLALKLTALFE